MQVLSELSISILKHLEKFCDVGETFNLVGLNYIVARDYKTSLNFNDSIKELVDTGFISAHPDSDSRIRYYLQKHLGGGNK